MNEFLAGVVRAAVETFPCPEPILEVGSYQVPGQERLANLRYLFPGKEYVGIDMRPGPGVDSVEDVEQLARQDRTAGTILALNVFEHVKHFWRGFEEVQRILRPDGLLIVSCPFYFRIHAFPSDYWRLSPEGMVVLLEGMSSKIIGYHGPVKRPLNVWAVAAGPRYPGITEAQHTQFRMLIRRYARQPMSWHRILRYRLGGLLFGRGHFAPRLEAQEFDTVLFGPKGAGC